MAESPTLAAVKPLVRDHLITGTQALETLHPPEYSCRPIQQFGQVTSVTAPTNHGKSAFQAFQIAGHLLGGQFGPFVFQQGRVLACTGENKENAFAQYKAALLYYQVPRSLWDNLIIYPIRKPVDQAIPEIVNEAHAKKLTPFVFVTFDTAIAYFSGTDENNNVEMSTYASHYRRLADTRSLGNPNISVNCHPVIKYNPQYMLPRGGGAFHNEMDAGITLLKDGDIITVQYTKLRGPPFEPLTMKVKSIPLGYGNGYVVDMAVIDPMTEEQAAANAACKERDLEILLEIVKAAPTASLADIATRLHWTDGAGKPYKVRVSNMLRELERRKRIKREGGIWTARET